MTTNPSLYMPILDPGVQIVEARFSPDAVPYAYKCAVPVEIGDVVVVEAKTWYAVATIVDVGLPIPMGRPSHIQFRWVVSVIDIEAHDALLEREREIIAQHGEAV